MLSLKRIIDIVTAASGIVLAAPAIVMTGIIATIEHGHPMFLQNRVGQHGKLFNIYKFQTMKNTVDAAGRLLPENERTSLAGKIMRKTKLDELPQLFNILKGDMSFVGPRPRRPLHAVTQDPLRQSVRPGLTGLAQIRGGNDVTCEEALVHDHEYIRNSLKKSNLQKAFYDATIILKTVPAIISHMDTPHYMMVKPVHPILPAQNR